MYISSDIHRTINNEPIESIGTVPGRGHTTPRCHCLIRGRAGQRDGRTGGGHVTAEMRVGTRGLSVTVGGLTGHRLWASPIGWISRESRATHRLECCAHSDTRSSPTIKGRSLWGNGSPTSRPTHFCVLSYLGESEVAQSRYQYGVCFAFMIQNS
jgi:hypothetical protein